MRRSLTLRSGAVAATAAAFVLAVGGPALAHVTVNPGTATQGGYTKITLRVPTESDTLSTTKVEVSLPVDAPIASVSLKPVPGWTAVADRTKLPAPIASDDGQITEAITKITWTAAGDAAIKPGQFEEFDLSLGPLPAKDQLVFKALQTYSDGSVVRWIDEPTTDGTEPEKPAPVLKLTPAGATDTPAAAAASPAVQAAADDDAGDGGAAWGIAGLAAGVAALILALLAYRRAAEK